jgi:hypothetical protein
VIQVTLASNAIHLEAARRLHDGLSPCHAALEILLWEPNRFQLTPADRCRWPLRLPARPWSYALLAPWALLGLVGDLRLAHRRGAGQGLRLLLSRARNLTLLDDGLDPYRARPRALDPLAFPAGLTCWLFSDAPAWRASWCARFRCRELGPLYPASPPPALPSSAPASGTLILDSPGLEGLADQGRPLPRPWCLVPHPVVGKRSWPLPLEAGDRCRPGAPEDLLPRWQGTVVVGESLLLLAALRLRAPGTRLIIALPPTTDAHLRAQVAREAAREPLVVLQEG